MKLTALPTVKVEPRKGSGNLYCHSDVRDYVSVENSFDKGSHIRIAYKIENCMTGM